MPTEQQTIRPQAGPQTEFLRSSADVVVFGGAAGGTKTFSLLMEACRHVHNPRFNAVIFRRETPQIRAPGGLWDTSEELFPLVGAVGSSYRLQWRFPSGAEVLFSHLESEENRYSWQGSSICYLGFDEVTHFTEQQVTYLLSRCRSTCGIKPFVRLTCNPDPDHFIARTIEWWIDQDTGFPIPDRSGVLRWAVRIQDETDWADTAEELIRRHGPDARPRSWTFIGSTLAANPILTKADPNYLANLRALGHVDRQRLELGNWLVRSSAGQVFARQWFPIIPPAEVPDGVAIRYWDRAASVPTGRNRDPDWTVGLKLLRTKSREFIVTDVVRFRGTPATVLETIKRTMLADGPKVTQWLEEDPGSAGKAEVSHLTRELGATTTQPGDDWLPQGFTVRTRRPMGSKVERANPVSAMAEQGHVKLVRAGWNEQFLRELHGFPDSAHDDQVDALSGAYAVASSVTRILVA